MHSQIVYLRSKFGSCVAPKIKTFKIDENRVKISQKQPKISKNWQSQWNIEFSTRTFVFVDNYVDKWPKKWKNVDKNAILGKTRKKNVKYFTVRKNPYMNNQKMCIIKP